MKIELDSSRAIVVNTLIKNVENNTTVLEKQCSDHIPSQKVHLKGRKKNENCDVDLKKSQSLNIGNNL